MRPFLSLKRNTPVPWASSHGTERGGCYRLVLLLFSLAASAGAATADGDVAGFRFLDLTPVALPQGASVRQFSSLPRGVQKFHGVPFRIGPSAALTGIDSARNGEFFPNALSLSLG